MNSTSTDRRPNRALIEFARERLRSALGLLSALGGVEYSDAVRMVLERPMALLENGMIRAVLGQIATVIGDLRSSHERTWQAEGKLASEPWAPAAPHLVTFRPLLRSWATVFAVEAILKCPGIAQEPGRERVRAIARDFARQYEAELELGEDAAALFRATMEDDLDWLTKDLDAIFAGAVAAVRAETSGGQTSKDASPKRPRGGLGKVLALLETNGEQFTHAPALKKAGGGRSEATQLVAKLRKKNWLIETADDAREAGKPVPPTAKGYRLVR